MNPQGAIQPSRSTALLACCLILLTFASYFPVLRAGFIWDDDWHVTANRTLLSLHGLYDIWFTPSRPGHITTPQYYPFTHTTFWIEHHLWGNSPLGYHLDNLLLHTASALLLWSLLSRLSIPGAWLAATLWSIHPLNVESVAWVTERKNVLSTLLYLASFAAYWRFTEKPSSWRSYTASLLLFLLALLSKTVTSTLPAALLLTLWFKRGRLTRKDILPLLPFFLTGALLGLHTSWIERHVIGATGPEWSFSPLDRLLIASHASLFYASKLLFPLSLSFNYPRWSINPSLWWQWLSPLTLLLLLAALAFLSFRNPQSAIRNRGPLAAFLFFLGTLTPALGFFDVYPMRYSFVADHFQYLAGIGLLTLVAAIARTLAGRRLRPNQLITTALFLCTLATLTFARAKIFHDSESLWRDALAKNSQSWLAHANLAKYYSSQHQLQRALDETNAALSLRPDDPSLLSRLALLLTETGHPDESRAQHLRALSLAPNNPLLHYNFGHDLALWNDLPSAEEQFLAALSHDDPSFSAVTPSALNNLATVQLRLGKPTDAEQTLRRLLTLTPENAPARNTLAALLLSRKDLANGQREALQALHDDPSLPEAHNTLANAFLMQGRLDDAIREYQQALRLNPNLPQARRNLDAVLSVMKKSPDTPNPPPPVIIPPP